MRLRVALLLTVLLAAPAYGQPADPIGELLDRQSEAPRPVDDDDSELEGQPAPTTDVEPAIAGPVAPAPRRPRLTAPVNVNETGKSPDAPPTARDLAYESRIRASFASAQGFQGPLDGSWTLSGPSGDLYTFRLVDKGNGGVEGAWLDLRRPGASSASGFIDQVERVGFDMTIRFGGGLIADLTGGADGRWTGQLEQAGQRQPASLRRAP